MTNLNREHNQVIFELQIDQALNAFGIKIQEDSKKKLI
jgi:hypothetical protein